jgi:hypothetical protein
VKTSKTIKTAWIALFATLSANIIAGVFGLFMPSRPDIIDNSDEIVNGKNDESIQELVAILEQRAVSVLKIMDNETKTAISRINNGSGRVGAFRYLGKLASGEKEFFDNLQANQKVFKHLHKVNIAAVKSNDFALVHEIILEIYHVLSFRDASVFWDSMADPFAICHLRWGCMSDVFKTYPGPKPENIDAGIIKAIWPDQVETGPDIDPETERIYLLEKKQNHETFVKVKKMLFASYSNVHLFFVVSLAAIYPLTALLVLKVSKRRAAKTKIKYPLPSKNYQLIALHGLNLLGVAVVLYMNSIFPPMAFVCLIVGMVGLFCLYRSMVAIDN